MKNFLKTHIPYDEYSEPILKEHERILKEERSIWLYIWIITIIIFTGLFIKNQTEIRNYKNIIENKTSGRSYKTQ